MMHGRATPYLQRETRGTTFNVMYEKYYMMDGT